ncbi:replication initiation factor domain-containing protein [Staphylococcus pseudintermedius]
MTENGEKRGLHYKNGKGGLTGYSNSRLSGNFFTTSQLELSFDAITLTGNLRADSAKKLSRFMSIEPRIYLWDILQTRFKAKALDKVYIEYDKVKGDSYGRRNMRVEFNPNRLSYDEMIWLKANIISCMDDIGFTRLDLAFDFECDLSDYYAMSDKALKKTVFYGRDGNVETKYFGVRDSDRFIRIYNKKQERKDRADIEVESEELWRVEIELKRGMVDKWNDCFNDLHILKPDWTAPEKVKEQAMVYFLLNEEDTWGKLERHAKYKYKQLIKEISPIDLTDSMREALKQNEHRLKRQLEFLLGMRIQ